MSEDWFAPKRFGYGAGLPIAWQGWAVLLAYMAVTIGSAMWLKPGHPMLSVGIITVATMILFPICKRHTRGGWRWRSGAVD